MELAQAQVEAPSLLKRAATHLQVSYLQSSNAEGGRSVTTFQKHCKMTIVSSSWQSPGQSTYICQSILCITTHLTVSQV